MRDTTSTTPTSGLRRAAMSSPFGALTIEASESGITTIRWPDRGSSLGAGTDPEACTDPTSTSPAFGDDGEVDYAADGHLRAAIRQLDEYFAGGLIEFDLPVDLRGTEFQRRVWMALKPIPFGHTVSYGDIAVELGRPTASRAVGRAVGANPVPIVLPCHRVIGSSGALTGFAPGIPSKVWLLRHEGREIDGDRVAPVTPAPPVL